MDIALNITTNSQPIRSKPLQAKSTVAKPLKKIQINKPNGFEFSFGGGQQKVKALVARKRTVTKISSNSENNLNPFADSQNVDAVPKKSIALRRKAKPIVATQPKHNNHHNNIDDTEISGLAPVPKPTLTSSDLMLNICTTVPTKATAPATLVRDANTKRKLSRLDRLNQKRAERRGEGPKRILTKKEISEGINRFRTNPNQKPRIGDVFKNQLNEELEHKRKTEEATLLGGSFEEPAVATSDITSQPTSVNKFRVERPSTKKIGLFDKRDEMAMKPLGQRFVKPIKERIFNGTRMDSIGLHAHAVKNLADLLSITELTTVQQKAIPKVLEGKDVLVRSQTGSGKTLAYALPVVEKLQGVLPKITRTDGILALVIVPTRELAIQTYELVQKLVKPFTWLVPGVLMGGESRKSDKARLRKGINILIGTPGRLVDHLLHTASFKLSNAKFLVLDEADRLLEMGYERDVQQIVEGIDKQRAELAAESKSELPPLQRVLCSATLTPAVQKLAGLALHEPLYIDNSEEDAKLALNGTNGYTKEGIEAALEELNDIEDVTGIMTIPENLQLNYVVVPPKLRLVTFAALLAKEFNGKSKKFKAIVFMSTMEMVNYHNDLFNEALTRKVLDEDDEEAAAEAENDSNDTPLLQGLRFFKLHGSMTQTERQGVFKGFRECKSGILLATDVVGRGIDVPEVDLVIQYSPPQKTADFVHRVGRTARAGRSGCAVLFLAPSEVQFVRNLEDKRIRISQVDMDNYLQALVSADDEARNIQEAASNLQHKFQMLIADDNELRMKAEKAFVSWVKFYSTFPKELKPYFNIKAAHLGHFAKSFAILDEPTAFASQHSQPKAAPPTNRLTYTERDPEKMQQERRNKRRLYTTTVSGEVRNKAPKLSEDGHPGDDIRRQQRQNKMYQSVQKSRILNISEFGSGLPERRKHK